MLVFGVSLFVLVVLFMAFRSWSDMPVIHDAHYFCEQCRQITPHHCASYKDVEYRTCHRCKTRTKWLPSGGKLEETDSFHPDSSIEDYDRKRGRDHGKWSKRKPKKKGGDRE